MRLPVLAAAATLFALAARAEPAAPVKGEMIVWSGGKTAAAAGEQLKRFEPYAAALGPVLEVTAAVVESAKVKGLKPGFFVVALGVCDAKAAAGLLPAFKALHPDVYTRTVDYVPADGAPKVDCPSLKEVSTDPNGGSITWRLHKRFPPARAEAGGQALVAIPFDYQWADQGDFALDHFASTVVLLLIDRQRAVVASASVGGDSDAEELKSLAVAGATIKLARDYGDPACGRGGSRDEFKQYAQEVAVSARQGAIDLQRGEPRLIKEGTCGFAEESRMISGEDREKPAEEEPGK